MIFQKFNQNGFTKNICFRPAVKWLKNELFDWAQILADKETYYDGIYNTKNLLHYFEIFKRINHTKILICFGKHYV